MRKQLFTGLVVILLVAGTVGIASAAFMNGGFEEGSAAYWDTGGLVYVNPFPVGSPAPPGSTMPTEGSYFAQIVNGFAGSPGFGGAPVATVESGLGLDAGTLSSLGAVEGSYIAQTFEVNVGDIISFDFNFLTTEDTPSSHDDFALVSLTDGSDFWTALATTYSVFYPSTIGGYSEMIGNNTYSFASTFSGEVTLGFAVMDVLDGVYNSALYLDNITVTAAPVPEPSTWLLLGTGLAGLAWYGRKRKKA